MYYIYVDSRYSAVCGEIEKLMADDRTVQEIIRANASPPNVVLAKGLTQVTMGCPHTIYNGGLCRATVSSALDTSKCRELVSHKLERTGVYQIRFGQYISAPNWVSLYLDCSERAGALFRSGQSTARAAQRRCCVSGRPLGRERRSPPDQYRLAASSETHRPGWSIPRAYLYISTYTVCFHNTVRNLETMRD